MFARIVILLLIAFGASAATTYNEFYCRNGGDNLNAGSTTNVAAINTYAGGTFVRATGVFTPASGDPVADGVTNGAWASIYTTSGATIATCIGLVTNVSTTTITISQVALAGAAANVSETAAAATCKVGGAWKGPNSAVSFPFAFATSQMTNNPSLAPRVNLMNDATYAITTAMTHSLIGPIRWQGYTVTPGDGGKAVIDCATAGASILLLTVSGVNNDLVDLIFSNSGATSGTSDGLTISASECYLSGVVVHDVRGNGFVFSATGIVGVECEAYLCNKNSSAGKAGFNLGTSSTLMRCISHDNTAANAAGFITSGATMHTLINCIADSNGTNGITLSASVGAILTGCDFYNNGAAGLDIVVASPSFAVLNNCNFVKNGGWGINSSGSTLRNGSIMNCGFGSGTMANSSGDINGIGGINVIGTFSYAANTTPWTDPANGDFRINLAAARAGGRGSFTQTQVSYAGTVGYPDVGAAQSITNNAAGSVTSGYAQ